MKHNNTVASLSPGDKAVIKGFNKNGTAYRKKLLALGLSKGTECAFMRNAPLGDPIEIMVMGSKLALRREEAENIECMKISS